MGAGCDIRQLLQGLNKWVGNNNLIGQARLAGASERLDGFPGDNEEALVTFASKTGCAQASGAQGKAVAQLDAELRPPIRKLLPQLDCRSRTTQSRARSPWFVTPDREHGVTLNAYGVAPIRIDDAEHVAEVTVENSA
jgi:hypothetical protein